MDIIKEFKDAKQKIYEHVGFKEDWVFYPISDETKHYWKIDKDEREYVIYGKKNDVINETGNHYRGGIYTQRFYNKWVYRGKKYTMIFCVPHVDGMRYFSLFNNKKEIKIIIRAF